MQKGVPKHLSVVHVGGRNSDMKYGDSHTSGERVSVMFVMSIFCFSTNSSVKFVKIQLILKL